jgi:TetR/AcrR family transcriptional regulator, regulator of autoinduction and epiphytic fitness
VRRPVKRKRVYRTALRKEQAERTRRRILETARRLMVERGYRDVSMQELALEAGVAYQTVYSQFGNKLQLALDVCELGLRHVQDAVALLNDERAADDPERWLATLGTVARRLYEPCADLLRFMRESGDPDLVRRFKEVERRRLDRLAPFAPMLDRCGRLRRGISGSEAIDLAWSLAGPETYEQLVLDRGWTPDRFERWLSEGLVRLVLAETRDDVPSRPPQPRRARAAGSTRRGA